MRGRGGVRGIERWERYREREGEKDGREGEIWGEREGGRDALLCFKQVS